MSGTAWQENGAIAPVGGGETVIEVDVIVIGAGQAGLAAGFFLRSTGLSCALFDRARRIGDSWRRRYDSLVLFSTRAYSALPGLPIDGDPEGYPDKNEIADYLERYAKAFDLPATMGEGIARLERQDEGFIAWTERGRRVVSRAAIVAAGAFQRSIVPSFSRRLPEDVVRLTAETYRNPSQLSGGRVLVVGGGATGRQIAHELSATHEVSLSVGRSCDITPHRVLGRDVMAWFDALGFLRADKATLKGRVARARDSFPGLHLRSAALRQRGVSIRPRTIDARKGECRFADDSTARFDAVVWAAGYRDDSSWLQVEGAIDDSGSFIEDRGVSPAPGLFYVGRSWQTSRASALLCGVADDAARIVERVARVVTKRRAMA